ERIRELDPLALRALAPAWDANSLWCGGHYVLRDCLHFGAELHLIASKQRRTERNEQPAVTRDTPCGGHGARPRDHSGEELDQQPQSEALGATERGKKSTRRPLVESRRLVARCALCVNEPPSRETLAALQRRAY